MLLDYSHGTGKMLEMHILDEKEGFFEVLISSGTEKTLLYFHPAKKELSFNEKNPLGLFLQNNEYQLRKIFHNKKTRTWYKGFRLKFSIWENKDVAAFNDHSRIIVLERRKGACTSYVCPKPKEHIHTIFSDGSYQNEKKQGSYALLIHYPDGAYKLHYGKSDIKSSALMELLAIIHGLEILKNIKEIRIVSDSLYVKKGPTEWLFHWKLNDWKTANGEEPKHIAYWKKLDRLTEDKYIEFQWVKGHSQHPENSICDYFARKLASEKR
jgi:ribonuclease HI